MQNYYSFGSIVTATITTNSNLNIVNTRQYVCVCLFLIMIFTIHYQTFIEYNRSKLCND